MAKRVLIDVKAWPEIKFMADRLALARQEAKLTQEQAAIILGTSQSYIAAVEKYYANPTVQLLAQMARAYKIPMSELVPDKAVRRRPDAPRVSQKDTSPAGKD